MCGGAILLLNDILILVFGRTAARAAGVVFSSCCCHVTTLSRRARLRCGLYLFVVYHYKETTSQATDSVLQAARCAGRWCCALCLVKRVDRSLLDIIVPMVWSMECVHCTFIRNSSRKRFRFCMSVCGRVVCRVYSY